MVLPTRAVPFGLMPLLFACVQAPLAEADSAAVGPERIEPAIAGDLESTILSEYAGNPTLAEARMAACHAVLGNGWMRSSPERQDMFAASCPGTPLSADRKIRSTVDHDQNAIPRIVGWHAHVELGEMGWDVSMRRGSFAPKKEAWGDGAARDIRSDRQREIWVAEVEATYDVGEVNATREALDKIVGHGLRSLGVGFSATPIDVRTPRGAADPGAGVNALALDVPARIAQRAEALRRTDPMIVRNTLQITFEGRTVGYLVAIEDPATEGEQDRGVLYYYDTAFHFVNEAGWPRL